MLANLKEVLVPAEAGHYCVGHFDVLTLEMARAVIAAAEEADALIAAMQAAKVSEMVRTAHAFGAAVEAALGHTPEAEELRSGAAELTDPAQAADYVKETGIDALAIAVGTAHGQYLETPKLDYNRIRAIAEAAKVPLVLHGGSGLSDTAIREAIASGISKIDIFTDINLACCQGAIQAYNDGIHTISEMIPYEEHAVRVVAAEKIRLFGNRT